MTVQQHSTGKIPSSHGRDVRRMAGKKGLFLILLIVLWVSQPGSWLWAGPALDKAVEGPSCFLPPTPSVSMYPLSLPHCKDWTPTWLVFAFVWDVRVKRECWGQPRVSDLGVWHKAEESVFELFPWWFWRAAQLKKHRVQWARTLESDKAEFKFNCCPCGLGPYLSLSESQSAHL